MDWARLQISFGRAAPDHRRPLQAVLAAEALDIAHQRFR
jgi:hypothetical protein